MSDDDHTEPPKKRRGRPPKLTVIEGDAQPRKGKRGPKPNPNSITAKEKQVHKAMELDRKISLYCKLRIQGYPVIDAQMASGYDGSQDDAVRKHMRLVKLGITTALNVTVDNLILEIEEVRLNAMEDREYSVALASIALKAKIKNLLEPAKDTEPGRVPKPASEPVTVNEMGLEEWKKRFGPKLIEGNKVIDGTQ